MIKVDIHEVKTGEKKGTTSCSIEMCGNAKDIITEVCVFIKNVRESLDKHDEPAIGLAFKAAVMSALLGGSHDDDEEDGDKS